MGKNYYKISGFTLIEMLIVVGILGVLASVALPFYESFVYRAKQAEVPAIMTRIVNAQSLFYVQPRTSAAGATLLPCFLAASAGSRAPDSRKKPWIDLSAGPLNQAQINMLTLGVDVSGDVYFGYSTGPQQLGGLGLARGYCSDPTVSVLMANIGVPVARVVAAGDLDGDSIKTVLAFLGIESVSAWGLTCEPHDTSFFARDLSVDSAGNPTASNLWVLEAQMILCHP